MAHAHLLTQHRAMVGGPAPFIQRIRSAVGSLAPLPNGIGVSAGWANFPFDRRATFFKLQQKITLGDELALPWAAVTHVLLSTARLLVLAVLVANILQCANLSARINQAH